MDRVFIITHSKFIIQQHVLQKLLACSKLFISFVVSIVQ